MGVKKIVTVITVLLHLIIPLLTPCTKPHIHASMHTTEVSSCAHMAMFHLSLPAKPSWASPTKNLPSELSFVSS